MYLIQKLKQKTIARQTMILLTAVKLGTAVATDAPTAGFGSGGGSHGGGGFGARHMGRGFHEQLPDRVPMPPPVFNPSSPYTVPQSRETPVSPASPGSVFGSSPSTGVN
jgi:hypothetical protein